MTKTASSPIVEMTTSAAAVTRVSENIGSKTSTQASSRSHSTVNKKKRNFDSSEEGDEEKQTIETRSKTMWARSR